MNEPAPEYTKPSDYTCSFEGCTEPATQFWPVLKDQRWIPAKPYCQKHLDMKKLEFLEKLKRVTIINPVK